DWRGAIESLGRLPSNARVPPVLATTPRFITPAEEQTLKTLRLRLVLLVALGMISASDLVRSEEPSKPLLAANDLYRFEGPQSITLAPARDRAAFIRRWVDPQS